jgi:capsular exopolysaccharide synthesis family protein
MNELTAYGSPAAEQIPEMGFRLRDRAIPVVEHYWQVARNNRLLIAGILVGAIVLGILATLLTTPEYRATTRVEISRADENVTNVEAVQVDDLARDDQYFQTQYELLRARSLAERVVRSAKLTQDENFIKTHDVEVAPGQTPEAALTETLLDNVRIDPVKNSNLVDISFISPSPSIAAKIANTWADGFIDSNLDRRFGATIEARQFLEQRLADLKQRLEQSETALIAYAAQEDLFPIERTVSEGSSQETVSQTLVASDLEALNTALGKATADRIAAQAALRTAGSSADELVRDELAPVRQKRAELFAQRAQLMTQFGDQYPSVVALAGQIQALDAEIAQGERRGGLGLQAQFQEAQERENRLRAQVDKLRGQFVGQRQASVQYNILQREVDTNRELYNALLQRYREIGVAGVGENNISVVDTAKVPDEPFAPSLIRNLLLALVLGLAAAAGIVFVREQIDQSIRDPDIVPRRLGTPLLGIIPRVKEGDILTAIGERSSELFEAYFSFYTNLTFLSERGVPRILLLTSSRPEEGKSISAVALAKILALQGKRVVLLDADMRHSGMAKYIGKRGRLGLSNYLSGDDEWRPMVVRFGDWGFDILGSGKRPPNAAQLLASGRYTELLRELGQAYDQVVIDGPPVLGLADAPLIATAADGVVMVMEANSGRLRMIAGAIERLETSGARVSGALITKLDERNASYGYGYGYGYGHSYGERAKEHADEG